MKEDLAFEIVRKKAIKIDIISIAEDRIKNKKILNPRKIINSESNVDKASKDFA